DFARIVSMFERFGGFFRFCAKLLCLEHKTSMHALRRAAVYSTGSAVCLSDAGESIHERSGYDDAIRTIGWFWAHLSPNRQMRPIFISIKPPIAPVFIAIHLHIRGCCLNDAHSDDVSSIFWR